jgi:hypothetical protein
MSPSIKTLVHCSLGELDEKPNQAKFLKFWNFEKQGCKAKDYFCKPFGKKIMFNRFKMFSFMCKSHLQEKILPKNMFDYSYNSFWVFFKIPCLWL